jgi:hypothetical protein
MLLSPPFSVCSDLDRLRPSTFNMSSRETSEELSTFNLLLLLRWIVSLKHYRKRTSG